MIFNYRKRILKNNYKNYWFISGTIAFVVIFSFLITELYNRTLEGEKKDYQRQQLEMAKNAASGITYFINHLCSDMNFLVSILQLQQSGFSSDVKLENFLNRYESEIVSSIFIANENGEVITSASREFPPIQKNITANAVKMFNPDSLFYITIVDGNQEDSKLFFQIITEIKFQENKSKKRFLGYLVNFNSLVNQYIKPLKLSKGDFSWIIDSKGRLIYHPNHDEMLFNSIFDKSEDCIECHLSFDDPIKMIRSNNPAIGENPVIGDEPAKVIAYYPIKIKNEKWTLVLSAFVTKVTENLRAKFRIFFILGFVILGVIISFSLLIYYFNMKRISAEEAKRNIEQVQKYQEQLNQASKLASIGELVDSVAHEINTPAGIISAHIDGFLLDKHSNEKLSESKITDLLNVIKRQTERISRYTRSLLDYSKRMPFNPEPTNLKILIEECIYLFGHRFRAKHITISKNFQSYVPLVDADVRQMEQVFLNIFSNAIDACKLHGEISISLFKSPDSDDVIIKIKDNGSGVDAENLDKIFSPFFSSKLDANGTGLGLSITKAILTRHKAEITVASEFGKWTEFTIIFPITGEA